MVSENCGRFGEYSPAQNLTKLRAPLRLDEFSRRIRVGFFARMAVSGNCSRADKIPAGYHPEGRVRKYNATKPLQQRGRSATCSGCRDCRWVSASLYRLGRPVDALAGLTQQAQLVLDSAFKVVPTDNFARIGAVQGHGKFAEFSKNGRSRKVPVFLKEGKVASEAASSEQMTCEGASEVCGPKLSKFRFARVETF